MLFQHHQPNEFHHLKTHILTPCQFDTNNPLLQTPTAGTPPQPIKKRSHSTAAAVPRSALRNAGVGEIVEVQGGHVLRATGRKDRHSKVCTAKGPRDRRVRLSPNTAIQFYDVQDRLGFDRPSKAVDWLMNKAKAAIDELDELPAWKPTFIKPKSAADADSLAAGMYTNATGGDNSSRGILPPSLDSDAIADTIKSFFPLNGAVSEAQSTPFQAYPNNNNSSSSHSQDLKLSLQSFPDPMLIGFDNPSSGWGGGGGFMLIPPHATLHQQQQQQQQQLLFHQRGPLQSSYTPSIRAWIGDYSIASTSQDFHQPGSFSAFSGYCFPARIHGDDDEEHDGIPNKPSSASSASRH